MTKTNKEMLKTIKYCMIAAVGEQYEKMPYPIIIDSGAAESVLPRNWCPQVALKEGPMKGRKYSAANGSSIKNEGERVVSMITKEGQWRNLTFQVCDVTRPLASVHENVEHGHSVAFNPSWDTSCCYMFNHDTNEHMWLNSKDGVYVLEAKIPPNQLQEKPSSIGQGR